MTVAHIKDELDTLREAIYREIHHRILLINTGIPTLKDAHLFFLLLPFLNGKKYDEKIKKNVVSVGIVHASLEEHEKIKEQSAEDKVQQLTVLSGDYYSGRYYELLAEIGDITLIGRLSSGIVARCEQQIKLYEPELLTFDEWLEYFRVMEAELISHFYEHIQASEYNELSKQALIALRIKEMIELFQREDNSLVISRIRQSNVTVTMLQEKREAIKQNLHSLLKESSLKKELIGWIEEHCLA